MSAANALRDRPDPGRLRRRDALLRLATGTPAVGALALLGRLGALAGGVAGAAAGLGGCVSVGVGAELPAFRQFTLDDPGRASTQPLVRALLPVLLVQPLPAGALADTASMAYSRQSNSHAFYQFAVWSERPVRMLPRLLQRRLQARGVADAVGMVGEPISSDWVLALGVETLLHDVGVVPSQARLVLVADLIDRRQRRRVARREFEASEAAPSEDAQGAVTALSRALGRTFDELLSWLEGVLRAQQVPVPAPSSAPARAQP